MASRIWHLIGTHVAVILTVAVLVCAAFVEPGLAAQDRQVAYRDGDGRWQLIYESEWPQQPGAVVERAPAVGTYNATYLDVTTGTGVGFDDPVEGATRRATVAAVLSYVDAVLQESGTLDIEFQLSQIDGSGFLAAAGPFAFGAPDGFAGGFAFDHLTTGIDSSGAVPDVSATVDFGYPWNSDTGDPTGGEFDLFSVLLHEVTHGLGILSFTASDGSSALANNNPGVSGVFATFDDFLGTDLGGKDLYLAGGVINANAADLTSNDVVFAGLSAIAAFGSSPPVYSPSPWVNGSSIAHFDFTVGTTAVMLPSIAPGVKKRIYNAFEIGTLVDLGYVLASAPPTTSTLPVTTTTLLITTTTVTTITTTTTTVTTTTSTTLPPVSCGSSPEPVCLTAAEAKLQYSEKRAGKEKMKMQWKKISGATTQGAFGDPVGRDTSVTLCIYDDIGNLVQQLTVDRAGQSCVGKPCWKAKGSKGYGYKDKNNSADGVSKIGYVSGDSGKGKADAKGKNNVAKGQTALPSGVVSSLTGNTASTIQMLTSDGLCIGATMNAVVKDDGLQYKAQLK